MDAQREACEQSAETLEFLEALDENPATALTRFHHMHAVSALLWGDWPEYPPEADVALALLGRCDIPPNWRTILLVPSGLLERQDSPLVLARAAEGHFEVPAVPVIRVVGAQDAVHDHGSRSYLAVRNALRIMRLERTTTITVLSPTDSTKAAVMALQWWGASRDGDSSGSGPFQKDGTYDDALSAALAIGADHRLVCVVTDR
jgi:hypothetical protein